jgi:hypothetical protein
MELDAFDFDDTTKGWLTCQKYIVRCNMKANLKAVPLPNTAESIEIADYVRGMAIDLERLSQEAGLEAVAACLRATVTEARRAKSDEHMIKLGLKPDRRYG